MARFAFREAFADSVRAIHGFAFPTVGAIPTVIEIHFADVEGAAISFGTLVHQLGILFFVGDSERLCCFINPGILAAA